MSPTSDDASKIEGEVKTNVATPLEPSRERVSETSGTDGSTTPLMNWSEVASAATEGRFRAREGRGAAVCCCPGFGLVSRASGEP